VSQVEVKNYNGQIYLRGVNLKDILKSNPLKVITVQDIAIFYSTSIPLERVRSLLKHAQREVEMMIEGEQYEK